MDASATTASIRTIAKRENKEAKRRRAHRKLERIAEEAKDDEVERVVAELAAEERERRQRQATEARRELAERWQRNEDRKSAGGSGGNRVNLVRTSEVLVAADGNHELIDNAEASDGLPTATMTVEGENRAVKIDSGARYTVAGTDWMLRGERVKRAPPVDCVEGIGGFLLDVLGLWKFRMQNVFGQTVEMTACIIEGCTSEFLVGVDFLEKHRAVVDFESGELRYDERGHGIVIPFHTDKEGQAASVRLVGAANLERRAVQPVEVSVAAPEGEEGIFIPTFETGAVLLAAAVTKVRNGKALVPAVNAYGGRVKLPNRKELGAWIPLKADMELLAMSGELRTERLEEWLSELGDTQTPLRDEGDVQIGSKDEHTRELVLKLLRAYRKLAEAPADCPPATTLNVEHHIDTGDAAPILMKRRRQAQTEDATIEENVDTMLRAGVIEESNGAWGFPVVLVKKKDGSVRFCIDYRASNRITKKDVYPLPRIDETLEALGGARLFTTLDLQAGYWQIKVAQGDRDKTAFLTKRGLYRFTRMPFGLTNAPATFQRLMNGVLRGLTWMTCLVYLDDIVVFTKGSVERHVVEVANVLERLASAGLSLKLKKCSFASESMEYLGHMLSSKGVQPTERLVKAVADFPRPGNATEVKRFVHLAGYYRKFIAGFGSIAEPLTRLLKKDCPWQWVEDREQSFERIKALLTTRPLLRYPDFGRTFRLVTDASKTGLGACLMQDFGHGWQPVAYASKVNSHAETNYSITELECLAVVWSVKLFRPYLYGRTFNIVTDHAALKWLMTRPNLAGRLHRWSLTLQEYDFGIEYRPGATNVVADALSRAPAAVRAIVRPRDGRLCQRASNNGAEPAPADTMADTAEVTEVVTVVDTAVKPNAAAIDAVVAVVDTALVDGVDAATSTNPHPTTRTRTSNTAGTRAIETTGPRTVAICGTPATGPAVSSTAAVAGPVPTTVPTLTNAETEASRLRTTTPVTAATTTVTEASATTGSTMTTAPVTTVEEALIGDAAMTDGTVPTPMVDTVADTTTTIDGEAVLLVTMTTVTTGPLKNATVKQRKRHARTAPVPALRRSTRIREQEQKRVRFADAGAAHPTTSTAAAERALGTMETTAVDGGTPSSDNTATSGEPATTTPARIAASPEAYAVETRATPKTPTTVNPAQPEATRESAVRPWTKTVTGTCGSKSPGDRTTTGRATEASRRTEPTVVTRNANGMSVAPSTAPAVTAAMHDLANENGSAVDDTLQLSDAEIITAQGESKFVKQATETGSYRGMEVNVKYGLAVINTKSGWRVLLPPAIWAPAFKEMHGSIWSGHLRGPHTYGRVAQLYWWPKLRREVNRWIRGCPECGSRKARPREVIPPLRSIRGGDVGDRWALDVAGPFPTADGGERFVIAALEYVTRYAVACCVVKHTAEDIAKFLVEEVVLKFGVFRELLTDGAPELTGHVIDELVDMLQAKQINPVPYRPQMIGLVERFHRTWKDCVAVFMQDEMQKDWNLWVKFAVYAYNSAQHSTVKLSPNELMMGRKLRAPNELLRRTELTEAGELSAYHQGLLEAMEQSRRCAEIARAREQTRQAKFYNRNVRKKREFQVGDRVWLYNPPRGPRATKFVHQWMGPLRIVESAGYENFLLKREDGSGEGEAIIAHVSFLVSYYEPTAPLSQIGEDIDEQIRDEDGGWYDEAPAAAIRAATAATGRSAIAEERNGVKEQWTVLRAGTTRVATWWSDGDGENGTGPAITHWNTNSTRQETWDVGQRMTSGNGRPAMDNLEVGGC